MEKDGVFFCEHTPLPFHKILKNPDLERLLEIDIVQIQNKNLIIKPIITSSIIRDSTRIRPVAVKKVIPIISEVKSVVCNENTPIALSKTPKQFVEKSEETKKALTVSKFENLVTVNEKTIYELSYRKSIHDTENFDTKNLFMNFVNGAEPLNRFSWKMIQKNNVFLHKFSQQYITIDNCDILLSGSLGGNIKNIKLNTIAKLNKMQTKKPEVFLKKKMNVKPLQKRLLLSQVNYNLKPGPLCKKALLNPTSSMHLGDIKLVKLPQVSLQIFPTVGSSLDINVRRYLKYVRSEDGTIDASWAEFSTSTVQSRTSKPLKTLHTFLIPHKRSRVMMRKDLDILTNINVSKRNQEPSSYALLDMKLKFLDSYKPRNEIENTVSSILADMLKCLCMSEIQDNVLTYDPIADEKKSDDILNDSNSLKRKRSKSKYGNELKKLNITVIDLDLDNNMSSNENCKHDYCKLGCVCGSLETNYLLNEHCGLSNCMFDCKCNLEEDTALEVCRAEERVDISQSAVVNLQHQMSRYLSKEEKKFHRTVIQSKNQTILLNTKRRGVRAPKKYEDYCDEPFSKKSRYETDNKFDSIVLVPKLPDTFHMYPWCMIHNLYKCYCGGASTEGVNFKYSNVFDEEMTLCILDNTKSTFEADNSCARRTDYDSELFRMIHMKKSDYLKRNERIKLSESKEPHLEGLLLQRMKQCLIDRNLKSVLKPNPNSANLENDDSKIDLDSIKQNEEEDQRISIIKNQMPVIAPYIKSKSSMPLCDPVKSALIAIPLNKIIGDYLIEEIYIWITTQTPYKQYITLKNNINCQFKCVPIKQASKTLLEMHPPFIKDINDISTSSSESYILLVGKSFAWEVFAKMENKPENKKKSKPNNKIQNSPSPGSSSNSNTEQIDLVATSTSDILKNLSKTQSNKNYWFKIYIGSDFTLLRVPSKHFSITHSCMLRAVEGARTKGRFIRFLHKNTVQNENNYFGLYASPFLNEHPCVFLGPYADTSNPNLSLDFVKNSTKRSKVQWLTSKSGRLQDMLDFVSSQKINTMGCLETSMFIYQVLPAIPPSILQTNSDLMLKSQANNDQSVAVSRAKIRSHSESGKSDISRPDCEITVDSKNCSDTSPKVPIDQYDNYEKNPNNIPYDVSNNESSNNDVIILPNKNDIVEISDSE